MKKSVYNYMIGTILILWSFLIMPGCSKEKIASTGLNALENTEVSDKAAGNTQITGIGYYATTEECDYLTAGATFAVKMTGDLQGCLYVYVDEYACSPSGTYRESGREHFIGTYMGESGSFWTGYKFEAKFEGCASDGAPLGLEIFGRCQHPIVKGSGEGALEGVTGRLAFKDDIEAGNFPFTGHFGF